MSNTWIGFDFDGTLATHCQGNLDLGEPIAPMVQLVEKYLAQNFEVRIMTARVSGIEGPEFLAKQTKLLNAWCMNVFGRHLPLTAQKDMHMWLLYDDRAVAVELNTGKYFSYRQVP